MFSSSQLGGLLYSLAVTCLFCWLILPGGFITGQSGFWAAQNEDVTQYVSGLRAYYDSAWQLPLLAIPSLDWPSGTLVTFVDGVPIFALATKALHSLIGFDGHPYGYWVVICVVLLGAAAWRLSSEYRGGSWLALMVAVPLMVGMASFWARLGHLSLLSHFLIVFALAGYFRDRNFSTVKITYWTILLPAAFYINLYLFAMSSAIYFASVLDRKALERTPRMIAPFLVIALTFPVMMGWPFGQVQASGGFGDFSMNLLSPVYGGSLITLPDFTYPWPGQGEGFNYLGLGIIIVLLSVAAKATGRVLDGAPRWITLLCASFVIYAISNRVAFGSVELIRYQVPGFASSVTETFRASGRFFWPVSYLLAMITAARIADIKGPLIKGPRALLAGGAILAIQLVDLQPHFAAAKLYLSREEQIILDRISWADRLSGVRTLYHYPKFLCGDDPYGVTLPVQSIAADAGVNMTTGYISRYFAVCGAEEVELAGSDPSKDAYSFDAEKYDIVEVQGWMPHGVVCELFEPIIFCRRPT